MISRALFLLSLGICLILAVSMLGCGGGNTPAGQEQGDPKATNTPAAAGTTDTTRAPTPASTRAAPSATPRSAQTTPVGMTGSAPTPTSAQTQTRQSSPQATAVPVSTSTPAPTPVPTKRPRPRLITQVTSETNRRALAAIYEYTDGENWTYNRNWPDGKHLGEWSGVNDDRWGDIVALELPGNGLRGEVPPELGNLRAISRIDLSHNELSGELPPELTNIRELGFLDLSNNNVTGELTPELQEFFSDPDMNFLDLSYNPELTGTISSESPLLGRGGALEGLQGIVGTQIEVTERTVLISLASSLRQDPRSEGNWGQRGSHGDWHGITLDSQNRVVGLQVNSADIEAIPEAIGLLTELTVLDLCGNRITHIPESFQVLKNLVELDLTGNPLVALGPAEPVGLLHPRVPFDLGMLPNLKVLKLDGSRLREPSYQRNQNYIANLCLPDKIKQLLDMSRSVLTEVGFCDEQAAAQGQAEQELQARLDVEKQALKDLYNATNGSNWWDSGSWMSDKPVAEWFGVKTAGNGEVYELELYNNNLSGELPETIANLSKLRRLSIYDNQLTGCVPNALRNQLTDAQLGNIDFCP